MRLLPNSVHRCRRYPTKFNSGRDIPFSSDGTRLLLSALIYTNLYVHSIDNGNAELLFATESFETNAEISPDGRWLAFQSNASGEFEIYVRPYPDVHAGRWQISRGGGAAALGSRRRRAVLSVT
jgi:Tol biopolymer transport system component